jgi:flagellar biosynthesis/type III secretory pathway M-ring protein FliF/YscJ
MDKKTKYMIIAGVALLVLGIGAYIVIKKRGLRMSQSNTTETEEEPKSELSEKLSNAATLGVQSAFEVKS